MDAGKRVPAVTFALPDFGHKSWSFSGVFFSMMFWAAVGWMTVQWLGAAGILKDHENTGPTPAQSLNAYAHIRQISRAQSLYPDKIKQALGQPQFAQFMAHLWITPDHQGNPVKLDLIPKKIALAMDYNQTLDGFFFVDIHHRFNGRGKKSKIDLQQEWAVAALPAKMPSSGFPCFLGDESGNIYVKFFTARPVKFPARPLKQGWQTLSTRKELKIFLNERR
nr:hypothetical protein [uncultured Desulfobacter sp.]